MLSRSAAYDAAVKAGARPITKVDVIQGFKVQKQNLSLVEGSISVDNNAAHQRSLQCTIADPDRSLKPSDPPARTDLITPFGNELAISMGYEGTEMLPVGIFRIKETTDLDGAFEISASDRSDYVENALFERPYALRTGWRIIDALRTIIGDRYPGIQFDVQSTSMSKTEERPLMYYDGVPQGDPTPLVVFQEGSSSGSPWKVCQELAARFNLQVFFGPSGLVVIRDTPTIASPLAWTYTVGADAILTSASNKLSSQDVKNIAWAFSEGSTVPDPLKATAEVTTPSSVLYPGGDLGRRPSFVRFAFADQAAAQAAANAELAKMRGGIRTLGFSAVPHPAHEGGDVVRVVVPEIGLDQTTIAIGFAPLDLKLATPASFSTSRADT